MVYCDGCISPSLTGIRDANCGLEMQIVQKNVTGSDFAFERSYIPFHITEVYLNNPSWLEHLLGKNKVICLHMAVQDVLSHVCRPPPAGTT